MLATFQKIRWIKFLDLDNINLSDGGSCPNKYLCTEDDVLEMLRNKIKWTRWRICQDVENDCCQHCHWSH